MCYRVIHKRTIVNGALLAGVLVMGAGLLIWPQAVATGTSRGLAICGGVIIPSLFPFLILAGFLVRSGISESIGRRLEWLTRRLFKLPGCCSTPIFISLVGGYPAGGAAIGELLDRGAITQGQARRMLQFCVNGGPAFIISAIGAGMLGSVQKGVLLFVSHITVSLLIGIIGARWVKDEPNPPAAAGKRASSPKTSQNPLKSKPARRSIAGAFVDSVNNACRSLLYMCGFVVLFAALLSLGDGSGFTDGFHRFIALPFRWMGREVDTSYILPVLLEVSCGTVEVAGSGVMAPFLLSMALGWGGLSVHCQLAATLQGYRLINGSFFLARICHGVLSGLLSMLLFRVVPMTMPVVALDTNTVFRTFSSSAAASVALLLMCGVMVLTCSDKEKEYLF